MGSSDDNLNFKFKGYLIVNWLIGQMVGQGAFFLLDGCRDGFVEP